ncbi:hypothetical protein GUJ93_ZPchr0001g30881 [Zizania palustris]|uniref:Uncharacterized protein n=1 Tax=Zizania palustris TaxID=103762 RepID=A0A8J5VTQ1_ZIZPA|nr:hypothetical protein GUJ93_ZPchr0001g30881 [Zizania palustris]
MRGTAGRAPAGLEAVPSRVWTGAKVGVGVRAGAELEVGGPAVEAEGVGLGCGAEEGAGAEVEEDGAFGAAAASGCVGGAWQHGQGRRASHFRGGDDSDELPSSAYDAPPPHHEDSPGRLFGQEGGLGERCCQPARRGARGGGSAATSLS